MLCMNSLEDLHTCLVKAAAITKSAILVEEGLPLDTRSIIKKSEPIKLRRKRQQTKHQEGEGRQGQKFIRLNIDKLVEVENLQKIKVATPKYMKDLENEGCMLGDELISDLSKLLRRKFPGNGLQDVVLGQGIQSPNNVDGELGFERHVAGALATQILHIGPRLGGHYLLVSNLNCPLHHINVFDTMGRKVLNRQLRKLICRVYKQHERVKAVTINTMEVQAQIANNNCGLFAVAIVHSILSGTDPTTIFYDEE